jgi:hypothetical protein
MDASIPRARDRGRSHAGNQAPNNGVLVLGEQDISRPPELLHVVWIVRPPSADRNPADWPGAMSHGPRPESGVTLILQTR